jgi:hypothetical protein
LRQWLSLKLNDFRDSHGRTKLAETPAAWAFLSPFRIGAARRKMNVAMAAS